MFEITQNGTNGQSDLDALRELLQEKLEQAKSVQPFVYHDDIAKMPCRQLVRRIITDRGERAAAVLHTKLGAELARRGKERAVLQRVARNGNGMPVHD